MHTYSVLREHLERGETIVLDGPMGSELVRRGVRWRDHGMRTDPELVLALHQEYIGAGADVIRTNTFQLNRRVYLNVFRSAEHMRHIGAPGLGQRAAELTRRAVELAKMARDRSGRPEVAIAAVMSPLEHCFRPDLAPAGEQARSEHEEIAQLLAEAGADLLLLESMNTTGEARVAAQAALSTRLPVWVSFVAGADGNLLSGEPLAGAAREMGDLGVEAILVNCAPPEDVSRALQSLGSHASGPSGAYAHVGKFDPPSWKFEFFPRFSHTEEWSPERYAAAARGWQAGGARLIGGCCGTRPPFIRELKAALANSE
jgi:S-methylmethionine-dependent homocysteine/selenocysteine methylase